VVLGVHHEQFLALRGAWLANEACRSALAGVWVAVLILDWGSVDSTLRGGHMAGAESRGSGKFRSAGAVELRVAARLESLALLRTVVGAVGTFEDLDFDSVADLRLAVDEACTRLIHSASQGATLVVTIDPQDDALVVEASTACDSNDIVSPGSFSWHVLSSLTDDVRTFQNGHDASESGRVFGISLTTRRAGSAR
jgi:anti-sigma regulatory factor (Ser/Thr protein kinase)